MRAQLAILLVAGLLGACSDSPDEKSDRQPAEEGDVVLKDAPDTGRETSGPEAGKPVQGPLKKPEEPKPPEGDGSTGESSDATGDQAGGQESADTQAAKSADPDPEQADSARAPAEIYDRYCTACHEKGMAGAPKISDTQEWQKRFDKVGMANLVKHSVKGYRAMPAKGTCMDCSEQELRATIEWMLDEAGVKQ